MGTDCLDTFGIRCKSLCGKLQFETILSLETARARRRTHTQSASSRPGGTSERSFFEEILFRFISRMCCDASGLRCGRPSQGWYAAAATRNSTAYSQRTPDRSPGTLCMYVRLPVNPGVGECRRQSRSEAATPRANSTTTIAKRLQAQRCGGTPSVIEACGHLTPKLARERTK